jgi:hypothetical protein
MDKPQHFEFYNNKATNVFYWIESTGLKVDPKLAEHYQNAHQLYLAQREEIEKVEEIAGITAGGMPNRVKCLHVLVAHSLAAGPGVNPLGDKTLAMLKDWSIPGPCWTENFEVEVIGE